MRPGWRRACPNSLEGEFATCSRHPLLPSAFIGGERMSVRCESRQDGEVEIIGSGRLSPGEAALLIAEIAKAAKQAHSSSGQPLPAAGAQIEAAKLYAEVAQVGLLPGGTRKDHVA